MVEEAVWLLEFVEIDRHFMGGAIQILYIPGRSICLHLHGGNHVHVIDPEARLARCSVGIGILPLLIGERSAQIEVLLVFGFDIEFEGHGTKHGVVNVVWFWNE